MKMQNGLKTPKKNRVADIARKTIEIEEETLRRFNLGVTWKLVCRKKPITLLRVTAVLTAKADGSQALGEEIEGRIVPCAPHLRNPARHQSIDENYVVDWISLANEQLLQSGANFCLDLENLQYVLERDDTLNTVECSCPEKPPEALDACIKHQNAVREIIANKISDPMEPNPYRDSVILLFRWGSNPYSPAGQACSGGDSQYIIINRYDEGPMRLDGGEISLIGTNNQLTHEFGHFMGLAHTHNGIAIELSSIAYLGGRNSTFLPLTEDNLSQMVNISNKPRAIKADLINANIKAVALIQNWKYQYDSDLFSDPLPQEYIIDDTPVDFLHGFPLVFGYKACPCAEYPDSVTIPVEMNDGVTHDIVVNNAVRNNVMSYWTCDNRAQVFSKDQVRRMEWWLSNKKSNLISRIVGIGPETCRWIAKKETYRLVEDLRHPYKGPEPDWKLFIKKLQLDEINDKKIIADIKFINNTIPPSRPWNKDLLVKHLKKLEKAGAFKTIPLAVTAKIHMCGAAPEKRKVKKPKYN